MLHIGYLSTAGSQPKYKPYFCSLFSMNKIQYLILRYFGSLLYDEEFGTCCVIMIKSQIWVLKDTGNIYIQYIYLYMQQTLTG